MKGTEQMTIPRHPDQNDDTGVQRPRSRRTLAVVVAVVVVLTGVIALHVAGVVGH